MMSSTLRERVGDDLYSVDIEGSYGLDRFRHPAAPGRRVDGPTKSLACPRLAARRGAGGALTENRTWLVFA